MTILLFQEMVGGDRRMERMQSDIDLLYKVNFCTVDKLYLTILILHNSIYCSTNKNIEILLMPGISGVKLSNNLKKLK